MENGSSSGNYEKGRERKRARKRDTIWERWRTTGRLLVCVSYEEAWQMRVRRRAEIHGRIKKEDDTERGKGRNDRKDALRLIN